MPRIGCATGAEPVADAPLEHAITTLVRTLAPSCRSADPADHDHVLAAAWLTAFAVPRFSPSPPRMETPPSASSSMRCSLHEM